MGPICPKSIWPYISWSATEFILKYLCRRGHNRFTKFALVIFPQKSSFNRIVRFWHNLGQNHTTLCPRQLCLIIHSLQILKYGVMGYNSNTKVTVNLPKNSLSGHGQFGPNSGQNYAMLCLMIHSLRNFLKFCGMMRHNIDRKK